MGSGKSAVGRRLARGLEWRFIDMDREVVREAGRSIAAIFRSEGEEGFRAREAAVGERLQRLSGVVISSGGGWACVPGRLESLAPGTLSVWLRVSAGEAWRRLEGSRVRRPLLEVDDPLGRIRVLLEEREPHYREALWHLDTDGRTARVIAEEIRDRLAAFGATG